MDGRPWNLDSYPNIHVWLAEYRFLVLLLITAPIVRDIQADVCCYSLVRSRVYA